MAARLKQVVLLLLVACVVIMFHYAPTAPQSTWSGRAVQRSLTHHDESGPPFDHDGRRVQQNASLEATDDVSRREGYFAAFVEGMATSGVPLLKNAAAHLVSTESQGRCDLEKAKQEVSWTKDGGQRRDIGICVQIRNDVNVLDEYIAFHWLQVG
jgi:hypothetical protein